MIVGDVAYVLLAKGKGVSVLDAEDALLVQAYRWSGLVQGNRTYAVTQQSIRMHRLITNAPKGMHVDHRNHDTLDNRKCNLVVCTPSENFRNKLPDANACSQYKGVNWSKVGNAWVVELTDNYRRVYVGYFNDEVDAAKAYDKEAFRRGWPVYGLNFPEDYVGLGGDAHE